MNMEILLPDFPAVRELAAHPQWVAWRLEPRREGKATKVPVSPKNGATASVMRPTDWGTLDEALALANRRHLAGVGFVLTDADPYVGIDLDHCCDPDTGALSDLARSLVDLGETYCEISPSKTGVRIWARGRIDKSFRLSDLGVEVYSARRYLTMTGWHIDGTPVEIREAPQTIARLTALAPVRPEPQQIERRFQPQPIAPSRMTAYGMSALEIELKRLAETRSGGRNHALNTAAFNLGQLVAGGVLEQAEVEACLLDACIANGLLREDGERQCRRTIESGMRGGMAQPRGVPEEAERPAVLPRAREIIKHPDGLLVDSETGEVFDDADAEEVEQPPDVLWREPQGLVRDIAQWISDTSLMPNWPLCIASAVSIMALMTSRHIATPLNGQTHLYIAGLGQTAIGKDRPLKAVGEILSAMDLSSRFGQFGKLWATAKWKSETAIEEMVRECPARLATIDEIGQLFQRIYHRRASSHESGMASIMRELWSVNAGDVNSTSARAGTPGEKLHAPALTILGVATHQEFYSALDAGAADNGVMNRWLFVYADPRGEERDRVNRQSVPSDIITRLLQILPPEGAGILDSGAAPLTMPGPCKITHLDWGAGALDLYIANRNEFRALSDNKLPAGPFFARTAEIGLRLATLHAVGRAGRSARIEVQDIAWGLSLARHSAKMMFADAESRMAQNQQQADYKLLLRIVAEAKATGIKHRLLYKKIDGRIRMQDVRSLLDMAVQAGEIETFLHPDDKPARGPHAPRYRTSKAGRQP